MEFALGLVDNLVNLMQQKRENWSMNSGKQSQLYRHLILWIIFYRAVLCIQNTNGIQWTNMQTDWQYFSMVMCCRCLLLYYWVTSCSNCSIRVFNWLLHKVWWNMHVPLVSPSQVFWMCHQIACTKFYKSTFTLWCGISLNVENMLEKHNAIRIYYIL